MLDIKGLKISQRHLCILQPDKVYHSKQELRGQYILRSGKTTFSRDTAQDVNSLCKGFIKGVPSGDRYRRGRKQDKEGEAPKEVGIPRHLSELQGGAREHRRSSVCPPSDKRQDSHCLGPSKGKESTSLSHFAK